MRLFFAVFALWLQLGLISLHANAGMIGNVVATYGLVNASGPSGNRPLTGGSPLFEQDKITVGGGNAQIILLDGTKLVVGPSSTLVLDKYLLRGAVAQNVSVDALRGTFRFITGKSPKSAYSIETTNAVIGIRGTGFDFWVAERTGVALLVGQVQLCSKTGAQRCIDLQPNCSIGVAGDANPARKMADAEKTAVIARRLPFLINQTPLRTQFRLNTESCEKDLPQDPSSHDSPQGGRKPGQR